MTMRKDSKPQREEPQNNLVYSVVLLFYGIGKLVLPFWWEIFGTVQCDGEYGCASAVLRG